MSVIGSAQPDVVKIKVYVRILSSFSFKYCCYFQKPTTNGNGNGYEAGASKKLCIDSRLASYRTIQCLIAQAFDIESDFTINAVQRCPATGLEKLTGIWSDWDLEAAIKNVKSGSYLRLRYELTVREEGIIRKFVLLIFL